DDLLRVEVRRVRREARARAVLDALVDRQDAQVAGPAEASVLEHRLQAAQDLVRPVRARDDLVEEVWPRQVQQVLVDRLAGVAEQRLGLVPEQLLDPRDVVSLRDSHFLDPSVSKWSLCLTPV